MTDTSKILKGPEYHIPLPRESLGILFYNSLIEHRGKTAFIDQFTDETLTYDELLEITCKLSYALKNVLKPGEQIAIYSENSIYYLCPIIAALYLGITTVPISHYYLEAELTHAITLTTPTIIFCSKRNYQQFLKIRDKFGFIKHVVITDFNEISDGAENLGTFIGKYCPSNIDLLKAPLVHLDTEKSIALIMFSSGTTGLPKGVMITHKNCLSRIVHNIDPRLKYFNVTDAMVAILPFFHASGMITYSGAMLRGLPIRVFWKFDEHQFLSSIEKYKIKMIGIVPSLLVFLSKSPVVDQYDLTSLEEILAGAAPVSEETEKRLMDRLNLKYIRQVYGMTETTLNVTCVPANTYKKGSSGTLVPGMMAAIRDPESGALLGTNQVGEIIVKGDMVMPGYYKNPQANKEVFLDDGFLRSGDLGYYDQEGHFFIVGRLKELIKYKGFQVAPAELESLLLKHSKVQDVGVIGLPDEAAGELPMAFIVKQPNASDLTEDELIQYVANKVSHQKRLRGGVKFIDTIPKNASGKILRRVLKEMIDQQKSKL